MALVDTAVSDVLRSLILVDGKILIDVGCGDGHVAKQLAKYGAHITGIDSNPVQIKTALSKPQIADESFVEGFAENLPLPDKSVDIVLIANSLHHFDDMQAAIGEAARVLKKDGILYISEPVAEGPRFELTRALDDETEVRAKAYDVVMSAPKWGFVHEKETRHFSLSREASFEGFKAGQRKHGPKRAAYIEANEAKLKEAFERLSTKTEGGYDFKQPTRVNILRKS